MLDEVFCNNCEQYSTVEAESSVCPKCNFDGGLIYAEDEVAERREPVGDDRSDVMFGADSDHPDWYIE